MDTGRIDIHAEFERWETVSDTGEGQIEKMLN
jgi:hypothetical protein